MMTDFSHDNELRQRAEANKISPAAEKARLAEMLKGMTVTQGVTADSVYARISEVREKAKIYYRKDDVPWPIWTDKGTGYIGNDTDVEAILIDPKLFEKHTSAEVAGVYAHEVGHDVKNHQGARTPVNECEADRVSIFLGFGDWTAGALRANIIPVPTKDAVEDQTQLLERLGQLQTPTYPTVRESKLSIDAHCHPTPRK